MFSLIRAAISAIPKAAKAVKKAVKKAAKKVKEKVAEVVEDVKETIEELKEEAEEAIGKVFTAARKIANEITSDIVQDLKKKMDSLIASGKKFLNNVKKFGKSVVNGIKYVGKKISGIVSAAGGWKQLVSTAIDFVPVLGNVKSAVEAVTGRDPITGRKLEPWERAVSAAGILGGPAAKAVKHGGKLAVKGGKHLQQQGGQLLEMGGNLLGKVADVLDSSRTQLAGAGAGLGKVSFSTGILVGKKTGTSGSKVTQKSSTTVSKTGKSEDTTVKPFVKKGEQFADSQKTKLKPNIRYKTGEYDYYYETDNLGRIVKCETDHLQLTTRKDRLRHNSETPSKVKGQDHAGHLIADRFGGSPELDNLVSQLSNVNLSKYKKIEEKWAKALKETPPKKVTVEVDIIYSDDNMRPDSFIVQYSIGGKKYKNKIQNN